MSLITELIERLRKEADGYMGYRSKRAVRVKHILREAADTIETLSAKVQAANMERSTAYYNGGWIPVSERLPEDFGLYLITFENGDVCQCEFNPDFIDEEHENGAFTYYHQYFDNATLGMIDGEEVAVDAIAWMQFEPFVPQESEDEK